MLYRALLRLLPASFRMEYGGEMAAAFAAARREARGPAAVAALWLETVADVATTAAGVHWELLRQDLRTTARGLARSRAFALTAVLVVALGVGANTAAFSVADLVLLRPLPFPDSDRLVRVWQTAPGYQRMELSPANWRDLREASRSFVSLGAYTGVAGNLTGRGEPQRVTGAAVTADVLTQLGSRPALGRLFAAGEDAEGAPATVLLSHGLWQAAFGADPAAVGTVVQLDGRAREIIGVMPAGFAFPDRDAALWVPLQISAGAFDDRGNNYLVGAARLADGVSLADARAELRLLMARLAADHPDANSNAGLDVVRMQDDIARQSRTLLLALCGATLCILLIACANLAGLLLARGLARERELAVRAALGAGRERLVRQLVTESVVLAAFGGALGVVLASVTLPLLARLVPASLPLTTGPTLDLRVLAVAALVTLATGLGFGVAPALRASRHVNATVLRDGGRTAGGRQRLRFALVVTEVAASVVLLTSAGLLLRALAQVQAVDPGFRVDGIVTLRTALPMPQYESTAVRLRVYREILDGVQALPGVQDAGYISYLPMGMTGGIWPVTLDGEPPRREDRRVASLRYATPGFFSTMEIPLRRGRLLADGDVRDAENVAVVSESFARQFFPGQDPLGRRFQFSFLDRTIVGVVGDIRVRGLERGSEPQVYLPPAQVADGWTTYYVPKDLVVRTDADPAQLLPALRRVIRAVDPALPISNVRTMAEVVAGQTATRATQLRLVAALAALAFLLAGVGLHGLLAYMVSSREREFGVRLALGARPTGIVAMVLRQGLVLAAAGLLPGLLLAWAAARAMGSLLAGVPPGDTLTFGAVAVLSLAMTVLGALAPARRAVRADPLSALRAP